MAEPLKNQFFQRSFFEALSASISNHYSGWSESQFMEAIYVDSWEAMELKQRMKHASLALGQALPSAFPEAVEILKKSIPNDAKFEGLLFSEYVQHHGMNHPEVALDALELFTQCGSAEFAIRPFIINHEKLTMSHMLQWTKNKNVHVRRLASEGCRPRLPWAPALPKFKHDPKNVLEILDQLMNDSELYVRKSVANNLNDITKDHPEIAIGFLKKWNEKTTPNITWITKQALRGLIKAGNLEALSLVGIKPAKAKINRLQIPDLVQFGQKFKISFELVNDERVSTSFLVDYIIHHQKANGTLTPKIFKLGTYKLDAGEVLTIAKNHSIIPITTRKYYAGAHKIEIQVNGKVLAEKPFILEID